MFITRETDMLKTFLTLLRGATAAAEEEFADRSALLILDQQIRDAAGAIDRAKRALAIAVAQDEAEGKRLDLTLGRIADLEDRAAGALAGGRDDLAVEAAEAIAVLEADRDAIRQAREAFAGEAAQLRRTVAQATRRLKELERGRRIASAAEAVRRLKTGHGSPVGATAALEEAEATLRRLRERQQDDAATEAALQSLDTEASSATLSDRLEAAGFGRRTRTTAADVLERLRKRNADAAAAAASCAPIL
jgi:phage shock protein A